MKKITRYTWKPPVAKPAATAHSSAEATEGKPASTQPAEVPASPPEALAKEGTPAPEVPVAPAPEAAPAPAPAITFDSIEDARLHLLTHARDKVVRALDNIRFHGKNIEKLPNGEIRRAIEGHVERQRRFPLDTANALRGRLRRESFTIFKKGSRGVSYVCAVKRRFRVPGQVFSDSISALIDFIEKHPMVHVKDLPKNYLGIDIVAPQAAAAAPTPEGSTPSQAPFAALSPEQAEKLRKMSNDLRWLVMEGYVTEFSDSKLFAPPAMAPQAAKKAEVSDEEHDPVDFPDASSPAKATERKPAVHEPVPSSEAETVPAQPVPASATPAEEPKPEAQA